MDYEGFAKEVSDLSNDTIIVSNVDVFFENSHISAHLSSS